MHSTKISQQHIALEIFEQLKRQGHPKGKDTPKAKTPQESTTPSTVERLHPFAVVPASRPAGGAQSAPPHSPRPAAAR